MKALAKDPAQRYQNGRELLDDLEKCKESKPLAAKKPEAPKRHDGSGEGEAAAQVKIHRCSKPPQDRHPAAAVEHGLRVLGQPRQRSPAWRSPAKKRTGRRQSSVAVRLLAKPLRSWLFRKQLRPPPALAAARRRRDADLPRRLQRSICRTVHLFLCQRDIEAPETPSAYMSSAVADEPQVD